MTIWQARKVVHAPEAFPKSVIRAAIKFIFASAEADDEDRFWADAAS